MKEEKDILKQLGRRDGMTVPDGYFADFAARMADNLEATDFENATLQSIVAPRTLWQRVRPYVYMAAMFAGVWCMLKIFTDFTNTGEGGMPRPSSVLAEAMGNEIFVNDYVLDNIDQYDFMDAMMEDGFDIGSMQDDTDNDTETLTQEAI